MDSETQTESSGLKASEDNLEEIAKRDRLIEDYRKQIEELQAKVRFFFVNKKSNFLSEKMLTKKRRKPNFSNSNSLNG